MIKLVRGSEPSILKDKGSDAIKVLCGRHDAEGEKFKTSSKDDFSSTIYGHDSVKSTLKACQHEKCCYSEMMLDRLDFPNVEHYRPKGAVNIGEAEEKKTSGYYWLAYTWENLCYCKTKINVSYKRSFFPLGDECLRVSKYSGDLSEKKPLLLDPFVDEPRDHIRFHEEAPYPLTDRGKHSIKYYGLRDDGLNTARRKHFDYLQMCRQMIILLEAKNPGDPDIHKYQKIIDESIQPTAEFSSMAIDLLQ